MNLYYNVMKYCGVDGVVCHSNECIQVGLLNCISLNTKWYIGVRRLYSCVCGFLYLIERVVYFNVLCTSNTGDEQGVDCLLYHFQMVS
jgi:hypothetical protein